MNFGNGKYSSQVRFLSVKRAAGCSSVAEIPQGRFRPPHSCAHAHAHTDRLRCLPSSGRSMEPAKWCLFPSRGSDGCAGHRGCQRALRSKRRWKMDPWSPCDRFFREPRATAANERSRPLLPLSRYSAGNKLVFSQASGPRLISWPSIPIQHQCNRCITNPHPSAASVHFIYRRRVITISSDHSAERARARFDLLTHHERENFKMANIEN